MSIRFIITAFILSFSTIAFQSCSSETKSKKVKISSKGEPGRLVLVSTDQLYNELDSVLDDVFLTPQPWFSAPEAYFKISKLNTLTFRRSFMEHQTILFLVTKSNMSDLAAYIPGMNEDQQREMFHKDKNFPVLIKDKWASPQRVYYLFAEDVKEMKEKLTHDKEGLLTMLYDSEIQDYALRHFKGKPAENIMYKRITDTLGMGIAIPEKFELMKHENNFFWFAERYEGEQLGIFSYSVPYTDTAQLTLDNLISLRDKMLKRHIPGPSEGTYMTTSSSDLYPRFIETKEINGYYTQKIKGWWTVKGVIMGGPFVMYAYVNKESDQLFVYEGFLYAPNKSKSRNFRILESVGYTVGEKHKS